MSDQTERAKFILGTRELTGLSQYDFADVFPVSPATISVWEKGGREIPQYAIELCDVIRSCIRIFEEIGEENWKDILVRDGVGDLVEYAFYRLKGHSNIVITHQEKADRHSVS